MSSIEITRTEFTSAALRAEACRTNDTRRTRRLLAIAMVLDGASSADSYTHLTLPTIYSV